jgi:hypothetical protein
MTVKCDACGLADAIAVALKAKKTSLCFCLHHALQHLDALEAQGWAMATQDAGRWVLLGQARKEEVGS